MSWSVEPRAKSAINLYSSNARVDWERRSLITGRHVAVWQVSFTGWTPSSTSRSCGTPSSVGRCVRRCPHPPCRRRCRATRKCSSSLCLCSTSSRKPATNQRRHQSMWSRGNKRRRPLREEETNPEITQYRGVECRHSMLEWPLHLDQIPPDPSH